MWAFTTSVMLVPLDFCAVSLVLVGLRSAGAGAPPSRCAAGPVALGGAEGALGPEWLELDADVVAWAVGTVDVAEGGTALLGCLVVSKVMWPFVAATSFIMPPERSATSSSLFVTSLWRLSLSATMRPTFSSMPMTLLAMEVRLASVEGTSRAEE